MKKSILNLGKTLNKTEQKSVTGGRFKCFINGECIKTSHLCAEFQCR